MKSARLREAIETIERSPFAVMLAMRVESTARGEVTARMPFRPDLLNYGGAEMPVHGGAIAALADFAACAAVWTLPETDRSATIAMTVNFCGPAIKTDLVAHATVRRAGRRIASIAVEIRDDRDAIVADALVTYKIA